MFLFQLGTSLMAYPRPLVRAWNPSASTPERHLGGFLLDCLLSRMTPGQSGRSKRACRFCGWVSRRARLSVQGCERWHPAAARLHAWRL